MKMMLFTSWGAYMIFFLSFLLYFSFKARPHHVKKKYRSYSPTSLHKAYRSVVEEGVPVLRACKQFGVPQQTLRDRVLGKIEPDCVTTGRAPVLSQYEEAKLVDHIESMASYGYGYTMQEVADIATDYAVSLGKRTRENPLTLRWIEGFRHRWPQIKVTKPRGLEHVRAKVTSEATVSAYFSNLNKVIVKYNLKNKPHRIFNCDEKGISLDHKPPYVVSCSSAPAAVTSGKSKTITILGCGSAGGVAIPPYFVFPGKRMLPDLLNGSTPGADGTVSDTGWSNRAIFRHYLEHHFLKYLPGGASEPVLLLLDGHKSHVSVELTEWALSKNIIIFILPAHTSHILQPMDVGIYGPFQKIYNFQCHKFMRSASATITRYNVCELACHAYCKAFSSENLQSAFRKTGIYPYDQAAVVHDKLLPSEVFLEQDDTDSQATVEGGIVAEKTELACYIFKEKESKLKKVKQEQSKKKPRNTMSKIVSGKDLTDVTVLETMKDHEHKNKPKPNKSTRKLCPEKKSKIVPEHVQPGPSAIVIHPENNSVSSHDSDIDQDEDLCCVCGLRTPLQMSKQPGIKIVNWAQCDKITNGRPCLHWTHLHYCTDTRRVDCNEKFYCPHCISHEE